MLNIDMSSTERIIAMNSTRLIFVICLFATFLLHGCASTPSSPEADSQASATQEAATASEGRITEKQVPMSPYSTAGMQALGDLRRHHFLIDDFLNRYPKPDFFFTGSNQKTWFVYLGSDDIYVFVPGADKTKRYAPVPQSIRESVKGVLEHKSEANWQQKAKSVPFNEKTRKNIEHSLANTQPSPYLSASVINSVIQNPQGDSINSQLFYFDRDLYTSLENEYSVKYEPRKQQIKLIFPQAYTLEPIYADTSIQAKKIYFKRNNKSGAETSLVVPDFLPGSEFYHSTRGNLKQAFASLYQAGIHPSVADNQSLRIRYIVKLCQRDEANTCINTEDNKTFIRAIVIAATIYDRKSGTVIDTITLK